MSTSRNVHQCIAALEVDEGSGGQVRRAIGNPKLQHFSPFLMLDHFTSNGQGGFPDHPHRGQETITYLLSGYVDHEDFTGGKGNLGPGDLQFMTAGRGIVHSEIVRKLPNSSSSKTEGIQLWVDLPQHLKMCEPRYRDLRASDIPLVTSDENLVSVKVICGESNGVKSIPSISYTPVWILDIAICPGGRISQPVPLGWSVFAYTFSGNVFLTSEDVVHYVKPLHLVVFDHDGDCITASVANDAESDAHFILVAGQPLAQPIVHYGPFVMTSQEEIYQAISDYRNSRNGFERALKWKSEIGTRYLMLNNTR
ncbi:putative pirin [Talaromyces proteolyticus]|uniref:Pirin n=1 Tax=Talaromyces proteolyticus TaxID=1131652 RepID=A0AAD4KQZ6_9EURO|nr:putative pirin [Talaromyces proteolyticus]KAH8693662.1 putative pirin [Talaromyces proteolyticus]